MGMDYGKEQAIIIEKLVPGGQGLGALPDGKRVFLWNALPGEAVIDYQITKKKSKYCEGVATRISNPSPDRIGSKDDCYLSTSPWQILDYAAELRYKVELMSEVFRQHHIDVAEFTNDLKVETVANEYYYRNKMEYALYWDNDERKIRLAFHQRGSHRKVPIETSSLERPEIYEKASEIVADLNARGEEARKYQSLLLRANQVGEVSGGLLENYQPHPVFPALSDKLLGYNYTYSVTGFFQINLPVYELVLQEIARHIQTDEVLDLYAGVGTIGLSVAREHRLVLVEVNPLAYVELEKNCRGVINDCKGVTSSHDDESDSRITPVLARSEEALDFIRGNQTVILDPPRAGCDAKLLEKLLEETPEIIIYLSCNPATQARDLNIMLTKYRIIKVQPYNFFPRTPHLENLVVLRRG